VPALPALPAAVKGVERAVVVPLRCSTNAASSSLPISRTSAPPRRRHHHQQQRQRQRQQQHDDHGPGSRWTTAASRATTGLSPSTTCFCFALFETDSKFKIQNCSAINLFLFFFFF
jgi:hypothetical protein